ncbi:nucleotidyltransferase domain-containing protein [Chromobacterium sp. Beijing]|uniref:nucleotidyltransferase domain-containing protein n=1 Tax=Chromobacterium sp. Beijing TaxID=2735795 RepID=UPI001F2DFE8A|nr:nucleotidyltransferase domain-containing protein [Chromobacterium sp. Beijing]UJB33095.1 nucleotidyltransferase domain-containing protein [Chromobacterium sp. Beijing]
MSMEACTRPDHAERPAEAARRLVLARLEQVEASHGVRILYAAEGGSRCWGYAAPDSDYDVRFVYLHPEAWYETGDRRDVIELPLADGLDISGWELRKALRLSLGGNAALLEWLASPQVYRQHPAACRVLRDLGPEHFAGEAAYWHYLSVARKNYRGRKLEQQLRLKKYLYVLRPLLAAQWVKTRRGMPPLALAELVAGTLDDVRLRDELAGLLALKTAGGAPEYGPATPGLQDYIDGAMRDYEAAARPSRYSDWARADALLEQVRLACGV